jgi:serine/alanine adding enzyme
MQLFINENIDLLKWSDCIKKSVYITPFQTPEFYRLCNSVDGFSADVFAVEESNKYTSLIVVTVQKEYGLKSYFSRRGIIYGGPVLDDHCNSLTYLLNSVRSFYKSKLIYIESRNYACYDLYKKVFKNAGWNYMAYMNIKVSIMNKDLNSIIAKFNYNRRREIKKSLEEGATFSEITSEAVIEEVYKILEHIYKTRVKLPLPGLVFFMKFWETGLMKAFAVVHKGRVIGGAFCPILQGKGIYTMYYCGERNYNPHIFPTHLAVLAALESGLKEGCCYLDFMGAGRKGKEYGVRRYKSEFGGDLVEEGRFLIILNPILFRIGKLGLKILSVVN